MDFLGLPDNPVKRFLFHGNESVASNENTIARPKERYMTLRVTRCVDPFPIRQSRYPIIEH